MSQYTGPVPELFRPAPGLARADAAPTSHAAAESVAGVTGVQRRLVLACIALAGERGLTDEEGIAVTEIAASAYRPRRVELVRAGAVKDSGRTRRLASGRSGIVWVATELSSSSGGVPNGAPPCLPVGVAQLDRAPVLPTLACSTGVVSNGVDTRAEGPEVAGSKPAPGFPTAEPTNARSANPSVQGERA